MRCEQCEMLAINGVATHEIGCPDSWKTYETECPWCGSWFIRETRNQTCCDDSCNASYYNLPFDESETS